VPAATSGTFTGSITPANVTGPTGAGHYTGDLASALRAIRQRAGYVIALRNFPAGKFADSDRPPRGRRPKRPLSIPIEPILRKPRSRGFSFFGVHRTKACKNTVTHWPGIVSGFTWHLHPHGRLSPPVRTLEIPRLSDDSSTDCGKFRRQMEKEHLPREMRFHRLISAAGFCCWVFL